MSGPRTFDMRRAALRAAIALPLLAVGFAVVQGTRQAQAFDALKPPGLVVGSPGKRVHLVEVPGPEPAVVFIHGDPGLAQDFEPVQLRLAGRVRTVAVDRPGYGWSERPFAEMTPLEQAEQLREALRDRGLKRPVLAGFSFGGPVAIAWASAHPDEVQALVLLAPVADAPTGHPIHGVQAQLAGPLGAPIAHLLGPLLGPQAIADGYQDAFFPQAVDPQLVERAQVHFVRPLTLRSSAYDWKALQSQLDALAAQERSLTLPVEAVFANQDKIVGAAHAAALEQTVPQAHLAHVDLAGHQLMSTHPDEVVAAVERALARLPGRP